MVPRVSVVPNVELAVSQDGVRIEYLTAPVVELTRYSKSGGKNGPPRGPEKAMLLGGVTINEGYDPEVWRTLASQLADRQIRVCLVEGGGFEREEVVQDLYRGDSVGLRRRCRRRGRCGDVRRAERWCAGLGLRRCGRRAATGATCEH